MNRSLTLGTCALLCAAFAPLAAAQNVGFDTLSKGQLHATSATGRRVIRDVGELLNSPFASLLPPGSVDFSQHMLIGIVEANPSSAVLESSVDRVVWRIAPGSTPGGPSFGWRHMEVRVKTRSISGPNPGLIKTLPYHLIRLPWQPPSTRIVFRNALSPQSQVVTGTVQVQVSLGIKTVNLLVGGQRIYVRPPAFAKTLEPLIGERVQVRGTRSSNRIHGQQLVSPVPYAQAGEVRGGQQALSFHTQQGVYNLRGGLTSLLQHPKTRGIQLELEGYLFRNRSVKVTGVKARVRRDARLVRAGQAVGWATRGSTVTASGSKDGGRRVLVSTSGSGAQTGFVRIRALDFAKPTPAPAPAPAPQPSTGFTIPFGSSGGITIHLGFGQ
jgi:hypothetical protein